MENPDTNTKNLSDSRLKRKVVFKSFIRDDKQNAVIQVAYLTMRKTKKFSMDISNVFTSSAPNNCSSYTCSQFAFFMVACELGPLLMGQFCQLLSAWKNKCSCRKKEYLMNMFCALASINWANSNVSDTDRCGIASKRMDLPHKHLTHQVCLECLQRVQCSVLLLRLPATQCARW